MTQKAEFVVAKEFCIELDLFILNYSFLWHVAVLRL